MVCARPGCTAPTKGTRKFCSHRCASVALAHARGSDFFRQLGRIASAGRRKRGHSVLRQCDVMLMAAGRYEEAARGIYDRGYGAGWIARNNSRRQLPAKRTA